MDLKTRTLDLLQDIEESVSIVTTAIEDSPSVAFYTSHDHAVRLSLLVSSLIRDAIQLETLVTELQTRFPATMEPMTVTLGSQQVPEIDSEEEESDVGGGAVFYGRLLSEEEEEERDGNFLTIEDIEELERLREQIIASRDEPVFNFEASAVEEEEEKKSDD